MVESVTHAESAMLLCKEAERLIEQAVTALLDAAQEVEHIPETDRITSLANDLEDFNCFVADQIKRLKGCE